MLSSLFGPSDDDYTSCPSDTFNSAVKKKVPMMVLFYDNGCGHCKKMKPEWDTFVDHHNQNPSKLDAFGYDGNDNNEPEILQVDSSEYKKFLQMDDTKNIHIMGYPTIMHILDGNDTLYDGSRTKKGLEDSYQNLKGEMLNKNYEANNESNNNNYVDDRDPILDAIDDMVEEETTANNDNMDTDALYNEIDNNQKYYSDNNANENENENQNNEKNQHGGGQRKTRKSSTKLKHKKKTNRKSKSKSKSRSKPKSKTRKPKSKSKPKSKTRKSKSKSKSKPRT